MEPAQHGVQDVLNIPTEVHVFHRTGQTDRAVFWSVLHASGRELWLEPWPDDRLDRTGLCLPRPDFHFMIKGQDIITFRRTNSVSVHRHSFMDYTARTARTAGLELSLEPRPRYGFDRPTSLLSQPIQHSKTDSQAIFNLGREEFKDVHIFSLMTLFASCVP
ncbi:Uncharacterized protein Rs2_41128 [Raphanus sativus]|nr:Uncharacterized protein Rs2_41128 [Raphanus sativus]